MGRTTIPPAGQLVEIERIAVVALLDMIDMAHTAKDARAVRAAAHAIQALTDDYMRTTDDNERNTMPTVDYTELRQSAMDHYILAQFVATNPALAERNGVRYNHYADPMYSAVSNLVSWRSPAQIEADTLRYAEYTARAAKAAAEATSAE